MRNNKFLNNKSLDMLLDTMCNTFGGICFIALMVAIISATLPNKNNASNGDNAVTEQMIINKRQSSMIRHRDELKAAISIQKTFLEENSNTSETMETLTSAISSNITEIAELERERKKLEKELVEVKTHKNVNKLEILKYERLLQDLELDITQAKKKKSRTFRTPVERQLYGYTSIDIWLKNNKLYCLNNHSHVTEKKESFLGKTKWEYRCNPNSGYLLDDFFFESLEFKQILHSMSGKNYVRIYTDTSSFHYLCQLRDKLINLRVLYNWHIVEDDVLYFFEGYDGHVQ